MSKGFESGDKVMHKKYGECEVIWISDNRNYALARVNDLNTELNVLVADLEAM